MVDILTKVVQFLFFVFNFVFFCLGIAVLGVGVFSRVENDNWKELLDSTSMFEAANILIAAGIIVAVIGFFGCCGAYKQNSCMLVVYAVFVVVIFILEIAAGIYAYTKRETIEESLTNKLTKGVSKNYGGEDIASKAVTHAIDWFQRNVKCCGASGPKDWNQSSWYKEMNATQDVVPKTCCKTQTQGCNIGESSNGKNSTIYTSGCVSEGKNFASKNLYLLGGVGVGIAVVQLLGILFSLMLRKSFLNLEEKSGQKV